MKFNILNFPWEQIGWGLRQLSLSGAVGNVFLVLQSVLNALPNALCGIVVFLCTRVLDELLRDAYSQQAQSFMKRILQFCFF